MIPLKLCQMCFEKKPITEFSITKKTRMGIAEIGSGKAIKKIHLRPYCKKCHAFEVRRGLV